MSAGERAVAHALIPLKDPAEAKTRLRGALSHDARERLVATKLAHVCRCLLGSPRILAVHVLTRERKWVPEGCAFLDDAGRELNAAVACAASELARSGVRELLVLPCDLPLIEPDDIEALLARPPGRSVIAARDWTGRGTNALFWSLDAPLSPRFGADSLAAHRHAAQSEGREFVIIDRARLAFDVDEPEQLPTLLREAREQYAFLEHLP